MAEQANDNSVVWDAAAAGNVGELETALAAYPNLIDTPKPNKRQRTPLYIAAMKGHVEVVVKLVELGSKAIDLPDSRGWPPFLVAAAFGHVSVFETLIRLGSQAIDTPSNNGWTPMIAAAINGHVSVIETLIRLGSKAIDAPNNDGWTPLFAAALNDHVPVIEALIRLGSKAIDTPEDYGWTPLNAAASNGHASVIELLVRIGSKAIDTPNNEGKSPLFAAASGAHVDVIKKLIEFGTQAIDTPNKNGCSPMYIAARNGHVSVIETLVGLGSNAIDTPDNDSRTPMYAAARNGHVSVIKALVQLGSKAIDTPDNNGCTPMHVAVMNNRVSVIKTLVRFGSTVIDSRTHQKSPLEKGQSEVTLQDETEPDRARQSPTAIERRERDRIYYRDLPNRFRLFRFLYCFEGKILWYLPIRSRLQAHSIVIQPVLEPGSEIENKWHKIFPQLPKDKYAFSFAIFDFPASISDDGTMKSGHWAPMIELQTWNPRQSVVTPSKESWNLPMLLMAVHKVSRGFGRSSLLWTNSLGKMMTTFPAEQSNAHRRVQTREDLNVFLSSKNVELLSTYGQLEDLCQFEVFFSYVAISPASFPDTFITSIGTTGKLILSEEEGLPNPAQVFYLDLDIRRRICALCIEPNEKFGAKDYKEGMALRAGPLAFSDLRILFEKNDADLSSGKHLRAKIQLYKWAIGQLVVPLFLTYSTAQQSLTWQKELKDEAEWQTWVITPRIFTNLSRLPAAEIVAEALYQLSPVSHPDLKLTRASNQPLLSLKSQDIVTQSFAFTPSEDTISWILKTTTTRVFALEVSRRETQPGKPLHFEKLHNQAHQRLQIMRFGELSVDGIQTVLIVVLHSKLYLKAEGQKIVQDVCPNPPDPSFLWTLHPLSVPTNEHSPLS